MDLLLVISSADAARIAHPLAEACARRKLNWSAFFTGLGVKSLLDEDFADTIAALAHEGVVCAEAWKQHMEGHDCPLDLGSQFHHSAMITRAEKVISL